MRKIVLPGEKISDQKIRIENTFVDGESTYASVMGMIDDEGRFIQLEGVYKPIAGDLMVGMVTDSRHSGYGIDLNLSSQGFVSGRDTRVRLNVGEIIMGKAK
ncbi:MAG: hypothetical protein WCT31_05315, partial [Candidatus Micrarchaeia archaeon]